MENIKQTINNFLAKEKELDKSIFNQIALYIFGTQSNNTDLYFLAKFLNEKDLLNIINFYDGDVLKIPSKKDYRDCLIIVLCFYLNAINNWDWPEIKEFIKLPKSEGNVFRELNIIKKVSALKEDLDNTLYKILKDIKFDNMQEFIDSFNKSFELFQED